MTGDDADHPNGPQVEIALTGEMGGPSGYLFCEGLNGWWKVGWITPTEQRVPHKAAGKR